MPTYIPAKGDAVTIDYEAVERQMQVWCKAAMDVALLEMKDRAVSRAPVRNIFKGGRRPQERVPRGIMRRNGQIFGRKVRHWTDTGRDRFMAQVRAQSKPMRRMTVETAVKGKAGGRGRVEGNTRTWTPIIRNADGSTTYGDMRRVTITPKGTVAMANVPAYNSKTGYAVQSGRDTQSQLNRFGRMDLRRVNEQIGAARKAGARLNVVETRRVFEKDSDWQARRAKGLKRPRTPIFVDASKTMTLGGRLRGEIYIEPGGYDGRRYFGDVVSPTEYAKYQEYGTSRHRAQPYMRPALYEMRQRLPAILKSTIRKSRGL